MGQPWNTFVEGDNLPVLQALPAASIDVAYLDPPYNTGNDFSYADRFRGSDGSLAGRHAAWLAVLRPRLEQVHRVLRPRGVVFTSIDDHEVAHLRLLLDEIFGEEQFVAQLVVNLNHRGRQLGGGFATNHEYVLVTARDAKACVLDPTSADEVDPADFPQVAPDGRRYRHLPLRNTNKKFNPTTLPSMHYPLHGDPVDGRVSTEPFPGSQELWPVFGDGSPAVWRWARPRVEGRPDDLVCRRVRGGTGERVDLYQRDWLHPGRRKKLRTIWTADEVGSTDAAAAEVKRLLGAPAFESPKPTALLRRLVATMPDDVAVLDPYAGSGTTGHAVAQLNAADGGTRTCLSITWAEPTRPGSHAHAAGYAHLAEVTRARLTAVEAELGGGLECRRA